MSFPSPGTYWLTKAGTPAVVLDHGCRVSLYIDGAWTKRTQFWPDRLVRAAAPEDVPFPYPGNPVPAVEERPKRKRKTKPKA